MSTPLSPRRRRLRRTVMALTVLAVLAVAIGVRLHQRSRPAAYRPDEESRDITRTLAASLPTNAPRPALALVTDAAGLSAFRNFAGHRTSQLPEDMGPGLAWGDFDGDGDDDLFLVSAGGALDVPDDQLFPSQLFENLGDGTFRPSDALPETRLRGYAAAWADYNGDGWLDLALSGYDTLRLFRNDRGRALVPDPALPGAGGFWTALAWGDFNNDRRLDLYACQYVAFTPSGTDQDAISDQLGTAVPFTLNPASYPAGTNALFRQNPDGTFTDVAAALGVSNPEGRSLGALWHDFDQDGWLDLYVANDVSDNVLYRNQEGRFLDLSHPAWVADHRSAMGLAAADFDRDGDDDLFISHWVAQENALYENMWADLNSRTTATRPQQSSAPAGGNAYPLRFVDIADRKGLGQISLPQVGWGSEFVDLDQDGWLDLLVANGSTLEVKDSSPRLLQPQELFVFWNHAGTRFHDLAPLSPVLARKHVGRGLACADYDLDGDMDFAVADLHEGVRLLRNDMAGGNWLQVRLRSRTASGNALGHGQGSTVIAHVGNLALRRSVNSVSYLSQSSATLHWGLGNAGGIDRLEVRWHAGVTQSLASLEVNAAYEVVEGDPTPRRLPTPKAARPGKPSPPPPASTATPPATMPDRERTRRFWSLQRAAMNALKTANDPAKAIPLFRQALELNPGHQDCHYYLAHSLAMAGDTDAALAELAELQRVAPQSHRAWQHWGVLRARTAASDAHLEAAEQSLLRAFTLNPEETGALLALGEVALLRGQPGVADERLATATRTNPRAAGGFFLRAYLAWKAGDTANAAHLLEQARAAHGPEWQPRGATSEGDVRRRQHLESSPLAPVWSAWDGTLDPAKAFADLDRRLHAGDTAAPDVAGASSLRQPPTP